MSDVAFYGNAAIVVVLIGIADWDPYYTVHAVAN